MKDRNYKALSYFDYWTRRDFLKKTGAWAGAGLLQPVLSLIGEGRTIAAAYPEEVLSIEKYTKGRVKPGMIISKDNAELVKDLCPEGLYVELTLGREIRIAETTMQLELFVWKPWIEATLQNKGRAVLDKKGQLWTKDGMPWVGGDPFPEPRTALEAMWNHIFHNKLDDFVTPTIELDVDRNGNVVRRTVGIYLEILTQARVMVPPKGSVPAYKSDLKWNALTVLEPFDLYGLAISNRIPYDASVLPSTSAYIPSLRRVRTLPSTQRFESTRPYATYFASDFSIQNDPLLTWSWTLRGRKPMLYPAPTNDGALQPRASKEDFNFPIVEEKFPRSTWELRPEVFVAEGVPHLPGAPYSKKVVYVDAITGRAACADAYDMQGKLWKWMTFFAGPAFPDRTTGIQSMFFADIQKDYRTGVWNPLKVGEWKKSSNTGLTVEEWALPKALLRRARR
jgi:hypothetical protein